MSDKFKPTPLTPSAYEDWTDPPVIDAEARARLMGKHVLLGLTYKKYSGEVIKKMQVHGIVEDIVPGAIIIRMADGSMFQMPPDLRAIREAPPGVYRLRSTGEEVENPDFLAEWTLTQPDA